MNIYITRHGQTDFNVAGYYQGCLLNPSLNEYGKEQAERLKEKIKNLNLNPYYFSSPLRRAYETAMILKSQYNVYVETSLIEGDFGIIEGMTEKQIQTKYPEEFAKWKDLDNLDFKFKNGESKKEIGDRIYKSIDKIYNTLSMSAFRTADCFIVSHSAAIRCLLLKLGIKEREIPFGTIYYFSFDGEHFIYKGKL